MAFLLHKRHRRFGVRTDVNLTPLIDVMTSLLAIFMITAPLLTSGIHLDLPIGDGKTLNADEKTLNLSVNQNGEIYIGQNLVDQEEILPKVKAIVSENPSIRMIISADRNTSYGNVIELMALLRSAGYTQVGLQTDNKIAKPEQSSKGKKRK